MSNSFLRSYSSLLLPGNIEAGIAAAREELHALEIAESDWSIWLDDQIQEWKSSPLSIPPRLQRVIKRSIAAGFEDGGDFASRYARAHRALQEDQKLSFDQSSSLLSFSSLIKDLRERHIMSSAQIARVLGARSELLDIHWEAIKVVLRALDGIPRKPSAQDLRDLTEDDRIFMWGTSGDASIEEGIEILGEVAKSLAYPEDITKEMSLLVRDYWHPPYLQIIHYQLALLHCYDHPPSVAYEFSPRSTDNAAIFNLWPATAAESPFLNNAKKTYRLDKNWARGADAGFRPAALALARLLSGLEAMPFGPRKVLCQWIRAWFLRIIEIKSPPERMQIDYRPEFAGMVAAHVASNATNTFGAIEQRLLDSYASVLHADNRWVPRGVGDSVFCPNLPRRKLGDCDFQDSETGEVVAYEAHAGNLTEIYLEAHMASLRRVLERRKEEWKTVHNDGRWRLKVTFVAHSSGLQDLPIREVSGIPVNVKIETFANMGQRASQEAGWDTSFRDHTHSRLISSHTSLYIYQKYLEIIQPR